MVTTTEVLEAAARDGSLDISEWPRVLEDVLQRLHRIVYFEFPLPTKPPSSLGPTDPSSSEVLGASPVVVPSQNHGSTQQDENTVAADSASKTSASTKEDNPLGEPARRDTSMGPPPSRLPQQSAQEDDDALTPYPAVAASYRSSINILKTSFADSPPHTVQRLAELVLHPRKHYRYLPPFLNALDRVVSVCSLNTSFPLATPAAQTPNGMYLTNGDDEGGTGISGDEGLGGALLTPIPWLRNTNGTDDVVTRQHDGELHTEGTETIEGPNGAGRIETVSVTVNGVPSTSQATSPSAGEEQPEISTEQSLREQGAVTQGELIRQEQEAGVVPVAQHASRRTATNDAMLSIENVSSDDLPQVRGPDEIGMSDLGPQEGTLGAGRPLDLDAALGRRSKSPQPSAEEETPSDAATDGAAATKDDDSDYVIVNAESNAE